MPGRSIIERASERCVRASEGYREEEGMIVVAFFCNAEITSVPELCCACGYASFPLLLSILIPTCQTLMLP